MKLIGGRRAHARRPFALRLGKVYSHTNLVTNLVLGVECWENKIGSSAGLYSLSVDGSLQCSAGTVTKRSCVVTKLCSQLALTRLFSPPQLQTNDKEESTSTAHFRQIVCVQKAPHNSNIRWVCAKGKSWKITARISCQCLQTISRYFCAQKVGITESTGIHREQQFRHDKSSNIDGLIVLHKRNLAIAIIVRRSIGKKACRYVQLWIIIPR